MSAEPTLPLRPGDIVGQRYEVERVLGVGGMGAVVAARDVASGARVAIKALLLQHHDRQEIVTRFHREARATSRLTSAHVARVIDAGALPSGAPYIVMELLDGEDLKSLVRRRGPLGAGEAAAFVAEACDAVAEAHALGIVHRDLKPANLFLARRGDGPPIIKVLDFGIAKFLRANVAGDEDEMTRTRAVLGSRAYMSPEQMLAPRAVDHRTDLWALGAILYFLLAGKSPFAADTTEALVYNVVQGEPPPLASLRGDLPAGLEDVVARCLRKARESRYADVAELRRALAPFAAPPADRRLEAASEPPTEVRLSASSSAPTLVMPRHAPRALAWPRPIHVATIVLAAAIGFAAAAFALRRLAPVASLLRAVAAAHAVAPEGEPRARVVEDAVSAPRTRSARRSSRRP